jgi:hypothetical protein
MATQITAAKMLVLKAATEKEGKTFLNQEQWLNCFFTNSDGHYD